MTESLLIADILDHWFNVANNTDRIIIKRYLASASVRHLDEEEILVHVGQNSDKLFFVHKGTLRLYYTNPEGRERNKAFFVPGSYAGAVSAAINQSAAPSAFKR